MKRLIRSTERRTRSLGMLTVALSLLLVAGCVHLISHYDSATYENLTKLKGEVEALMQTGVENGLQGEQAYLKLDRIRILAYQAYEYETGKKRNDETIEQLEIIRKNIDEVWNRFIGSSLDGSGNCANNPPSAPTEGCLSSGYCQGKLSTLRMAFDIAIATEQGKIKDEE